MFSSQTDHRWWPHQNLYTYTGARKYLNAEERKRFLIAADKQKTSLRLFCILLLSSGCRVSEATQLRPENILVSENTILIRSLKKRGTGEFRAIPQPSVLIKELAKNAPELGQPFWPWQRTWAWMQVKLVMREADIHGPQATSRGLRHSFGVNAVMTGIPLTLVQKWLGHAELSTTAIYTNVLGSEEREIAKRMWNVDGQRLD